MIGDYRFPHNLIIEAIIEFGIIGGVSIVMLGLSGFNTMRKILKNKTSNAYSKILIVVWIYATVNSMFSGNFITSSLPFFVSTGFLVGVNISHRKMITRPDNSASRKLFFSTIKSRQGLT